MSEISKLPGDIKTRQKFDPKTKTLHVEPIKTASVGYNISQEDWDLIFSDCKEEKRSGISEKEDQDCEEEEQFPDTPQCEQNKPQQEDLTDGTCSPKSDS